MTQHKQIRDAVKITGHNVRKCTFRRVRQAKIQISLRIRAVWSESSLGAFLIAWDTTFHHADNEDWSHRADAHVGADSEDFVCVCGGGGSGWGGGGGGGAVGSIVLGFYYSRYPTPSPPPPPPPTHTLKIKFHFHKFGLILLFNKYI